MAFIDFSLLEPGFNIRAKTQIQKRISTEENQGYGASKQKKLLNFSQNSEKMS